MSNINLIRLETLPKQRDLARGRVRSRASNIVTGTVWAQTWDLIWSLVTDPLASQLDEDFHKYQRIDDEQTRKNGF